ncbi:unnamed protein product [Prunus armeniaca]
MELVPCKRWQAGNGQWWSVVVGGGGGRGGRWPAVGGGRWRWAAMMVGGGRQLWLDMDMWHSMLALEGIVCNFDIF